MIGLRILEIIASVFCLYATWLLTNSKPQGCWWGLAGQTTGLYCIVWGGYWGWLPLDLSLGVIYFRACWKRLL
tara:strand:+ start:1557 stop:1775 length:219 start_codon:yes stop_codon:yes gene_type:complete